ncbi:MAG: hypothetical protein JXB17_13795 [Bacteroidales bacterium]|nr:hypothetical protein [Bacteroidales bacterium]
MLILNITQTEIINPVKKIYQRDLNDGRYDGDYPKWLRKEIKHKEP